MSTTTHHLPYLSLTGATTAGAICSAGFSRAASLLHRWSCHGNPICLASSLVHIIINHLHCSWSSSNETVRTPSAAKTQVGRVPFYLLDKHGNGRRRPASLPQLLEQAVSLLVLVRPVSHRQAGAVTPVPSTARPKSVGRGADAKAHSQGYSPLPAKASGGTIMELLAQLFPSSHGGSSWYLLSVLVYGHGTLLIGGSWARMRQRDLIDSDL